MKSELEKFLKKNRKFSFISMTILFALIGLISLGYAWVAYWVNSTTSVMSITAAEIAMSYSQKEDGPATTSVIDLAPGESVVRRYEINNYGDEAQNVNLIWKDVINTFYPNDDLYYKLYTESETGEVENLASERYMPTTNVSIANGISVDANSTKTLTLIVTYKITEDVQEADMSYFSGNIDVDMGSPRPLETFIDLYQSDDTNLTANTEFYLIKKIPSNEIYDYDINKSACDNGVELAYNGFTGEFNTPSSYVSTYCRVYFDELNVYRYTGSYQIFTVENSGYYNIRAYGAKGGGTNGGYGSATEGTVYLTSGEKLYIYVGGKGGQSSNNQNVGGYNGGGYSGINSYGGGGATDIRCFGSGGTCTTNSSNLAWNDSTGLNSRIMVAAGGGGSYQNPGTTIGGIAFGLIGGSGRTSLKEYYEVPDKPTGGTQTEGGGSYIANGSGSFGYASQSNSSENGGGGGGGYYGGATGHYNSGSAGSSYISGFAGTPGNHDTKYFINGHMGLSNNLEDGKVKITYLGSDAPERINPTLNNVRYIKDCVSTSNMQSVNNNEARWVEIQALVNGTNIVSSPVVNFSPSSSSGSQASLYDGDIDSEVYVESTGSGTKCVTLNLGSTYNIDELAVWHYYEDHRVYSNSYTYTSSDGTNWYLAINQPGPETANGKRENAWTLPNHIITKAGTEDITTYTLPNKSIPGYYLDGWYTDSQLTNKRGNINQQIGVLSDDILYAKYTPISYNIQINLGGGTLSSQVPTSVQTGEQIVIPNPTKGTDSISLGCNKFLGWRITGMDNSEHIFGNDIVISTTEENVYDTRFMNLRSAAGTVTFTAVWYVPSYTVTFSANGGDGTSQTYSDILCGTYIDDTYTHGSTNVLSLMGNKYNSNEPGVTYYPNGWSRTADGEVEVIPITGNTVVYAHRIDNAIFTYTGKFGVSTTTLAVAKNNAYTNTRFGISDDDWQVYFLESGTLTLTSDITTDIFMVGGGKPGSSGSSTSSSASGGKGGNGGTSVTRLSYVIQAGTYEITIGASGKATLFDTLLSAASGGGGGGGTGASGSSTHTGSNGGSGTEAFTGERYGGGGGGGATGSSGVHAVGKGKDGGGNGGWWDIKGKPGTANTGGGGGGGGGYSGHGASGGGAGGSGVIIIRNAR